MNEQYVSEAKRKELEKITADTEKEEKQLAKKSDEAKEKVAQAEQESADLNAKLKEEKAKKQKVRVEYYATVKTRIKEVEKQINADCKLDPKVNELINKAAKNPEAKQ